MRVTIHGQIYTIHFAHYNPNDRFEAKMSRVTPSDRNRHTYCTMHPGECSNQPHEKRLNDSTCGTEGSRTAVSYAPEPKRDRHGRLRRFPFNKSIGRKVALTKVLDDFFPRERDAKRPYYGRSALNMSEIIAHKEYRQQAWAEYFAALKERRDG